jgi:hypothetical protein
MANIQVRLNFIDNIRGTEQLYFHGYKFRSNKSLGEKTYWQCVIPHCTVRVTTANKNLQKYPAQKHNHAPVPFLMLVDAFKAKLVNRAKTETTPIPKIYGDEIANLRRNHEVVPDGLLEELPTFTAMKTIMHRQRHKTLPRLPKTRYELDLQDEWTRTEGGDPWLHRVDGEEPILIFTTDKNLELLCEADVVYEAI